MYGFLRIVLLFYLKLLSYLELLGFRLDPYNICVDNKVINSKQMTITWHVNDLQISHAEESEVAKVID